MTLILGVVAKDYAILVGDRLLTTINAVGEIERLSEPANKLFSNVRFVDGVLSFAFCRFAGTPDGKFWTSRWLERAIAAATVGDQEMFPTLNRLTNAATHEFRANPDLTSFNGDKRLQIAMVGFFDRGDGRSDIYEAQITNCSTGVGVEASARDEFLCLPSARVKVSRDVLFIGWGDLAALGKVKRQKQEVFALASRRAESEKVLQAMVATVRAAEMKTKTIGSAIDATVMTAERTVTMMRRMPKPNNGGLAFEGPPTFLRDFGFAQTWLETSPFYSGTGLDEPCGCNSGKTSRMCHPPKQT